MANKDYYCVIMAGGVGSRFWPLSRTSKPKQFLDILGTGNSLLQMTFNRFNDICPSENIYIVTNADYKETILAQLPEIGEEQVLLEPARRNTAPCIAYANYRILEQNANAKIVTAPSDHLIIKENEFKRVIKEGLEFVGENETLLTLGIKPSRPETGYGYIQVEDNKASKECNTIFKVKTFTEKPNVEMAKIFYESGEFFWNSGIFIWSLSAIMKSFKKYLPEIDDLFKEGIGIYNTSEESDFISKTYYECRNISIDYGIMEKADNVYVYCSDFGWADLGTWGSLHEHIQQDDNKNAIIGKNVMSYEVKNTIVNVPDNKLVVLEGLEDFIVVESGDVLLVCRKENEQNIKNIVNDVKLKLGDKFI